MINSSEELEVGQRAPDFSLTDATGATQTLSALRGSPAVVFFYPAAFTPGCTTEACDFRDSLASFRSAGYAVLGISPDPVARLAEFATSRQRSLRKARATSPLGVGRVDSRRGMVIVIFLVAPGPRPDVRRSAGVAGLASSVRRAHSATVHAGGMAGRGVRARPLV